MTFSHADDQHHKWFSQKKRKSQKLIISEKNICHKKINISAGSSCRSSPKPVHWKHQGCEKPGLPQGEQIAIHCFQLPPLISWKIMFVKISRGILDWNPSFLNLTRASGSPTLWTLQRETSLLMSLLMLIYWRPMVTLVHEHFNNIKALITSINDNFHTISLWWWSRSELLWLPVQWFWRCWHCSIFQGPAI